MPTARQVLDQAYSIARLDALAADPSAFAEALAGAPPVDLADLAAYEAALVDALHAIEALVARAMKLRLDHALADDRALPAETRNVFAGTVAHYGADPNLLARRAHDAAVRGRSPDPTAVAEAVVAAARSVLDLRARLRELVLAAAAAHATLALPVATARALDRRLDDAPRRAWSAARRDLEALAADPTHLLTAPRDRRLAALPPQLDEPPAAAEPSLAELLELD